VAADRRILRGSSVVAVYLERSLEGRLRLAWIYWSEWSETGRGYYAVISYLKNCVVLPRLVVSEAPMFQEGITNEGQPVVVAALDHFAILPVELFNAICKRAGIARRIQDPDGSWRLDPPCCPTCKSTIPVAGITHIDTGAVVSPVCHDFWHIPYRNWEERTM
jgi:hypothetical protein